MPPNDPRIQKLLTTIQSERKNLEGAKAVIRAVEASSKNELVIQQAQNEMRAAQEAIQFLEEELSRLQMSASQSPPPRPPPRDDGLSPNFGYNDPGGRITRPDQGQGGYGTAPLDRKPLPPPPSPGHDGRPPNESRQGQPKPSQLDLLRKEAPLTGAKITRMLNQLQFQLKVEEQYKLGIEKMAQAYKADGDRRLGAETETKRIESDRKIQLLKQAKRRYERLAEAGVEVVDDEDDLMPDTKRKEALRKPISGKLQISIRSAKDLNHRAASRRQKVETSVAIKIEGNERAISHPARGDRWFEDFDIPVDKANEVELTIYDTVAPGDSTPIGMLWLRVSDLLEALRRQKVAGEGAGNWVTADKAASLGGRQGGAVAPAEATLHQAGAPRGHGGAAADGKTEGIEGWFSVEPAGAIQLHLNFVKDTVAGGRRPYEALGRQGAVRKRKGDVHEMNGHKFVQRQFFQPIMCALCQEFLLTGEGYQCEDCRYACHKKCYPKVVTKCISKSTDTGEGDEEKINHRIPHRFQKFANVSANWCCHCGYMLPFGRKNAVKCSECNLTCHQTCSHLVPDFCGMTMEMANTLLKNLRDIKTTQGTKSRPVTMSHPHEKEKPALQVTPPPQQQQPQLPEKPGAPGLYPPQEQRIPSSPPRIPAPQAYPDFSQPRPQPPSPGRQQQPPYQQSQSQPQQPQQQARPPAHQRIPSYDGRPQVEAAYTQTPGLTPSPRPQSQQPQPPQRIPSPQMPQQFPQPMASGYRPPAPMPVAQAPSRPSYVPPPQQQQQPQQPQQQQVQIRPPPQQQQARPPPQQPVRPPQQQVRKRKVGLDDFNFLAVLGKGNFGKVMLAEERATSSLYAIKVLKKEFIIENDEVESTQSEKRVFLAAAQERHPFLLGLHSCFQTETRVYFVMDYISGGDLMLHIQRRQFTLRQAKFYACEVLLALQYFHSKGIIYRDLKLDNILLTLDGHVKVADYGLCKEEMWYGRETTTFCGTPEFMAPEILQELPYGRAVDWWAFGVLTYEMLLGQSPFRGDDEDEIFDAILEDDPLYPITMPRDAVSLLERLLTRDPKRRLGAGEADAEEIKRHQFFQDVNFDDVYYKRIPPPYFPSIGNPTDTSNFDQEFTREQPTLTPVHTQLTAQDQAEFAGFSWIAPWAAQ